MRKIKCTKYLLFSLLFILLLGLVNPSSVSAITADANRFLFATSLQYNTNPNWSAPQRYDEYVPYAELSAVQMNTYPSLAPTGNYVNINGKMNVSLIDNNVNHNFPYTQDLWDLTVICGWGGQTLVTDGASVSYSLGTWQGIVNNRESKVKYIDLTFQFSGHFPQGYNGIGTNQLLSCAVRRKTPRAGGYYEPFAIGQLNNTYVYSNNSAYNGYLSVETSNDAEIQAVIGVQNAINNQTSILIENQAKDEQDRENIQNQSNDAKQQGQNAGDAAANKGQTLLQAFGSLITALQQVHVTNCNLPNVTVYSLQLTNMDMCSVSLPTGVSALIGISISVLIVLLGIKLVKRMLKLYKEITG